MEKSVLRSLFESWAKYCYVHPIWLCCMLIALITSFIYYRRENIYLYFIVYIITGLISFFTGPVIQISTNIEKRLGTIIIEAGNMLLAIIEVAVFSTFFYKIIKTKFSYNLIYIGSILIYFLIVIFVFKITDNNFTRKNIIKFSFWIYVLEFIFLLTLCFSFFYSLLKKGIPDTKPLLKRPSVWITMGLFFYIIISLPFFQIADYLLFNDRNIYIAMFTAHSVSTSFLFLCLAKAFSCKIPLTA